MRLSMLLLFVLVNFVSSCKSANDEQNPLLLKFDFSRASEKDSLGWSAVVRDLPEYILDEVERRVSQNESLGPAGPDVDRSKLPSYPEELSHWLINFGIFPLPPETGILGSGFLCQGDNHSDDLDMWIIRKIGQKEGLKPNTSYRVKLDVKFASNAQAGGVGVGGSEDSLAVQLGITSRDPREKKTVPGVERSVTFAEGIIQSDFDTGSTIANGLDYSMDNKPYRIVAVRNNNVLTVRTDEKAELWLMAGTHSGYESFQAIYFTEFNAELIPQK